MTVQTAASRVADHPAAVADFAGQPEVPLPPLPAHWRSLPRVFVHRARELWGLESMADSTGASKTFGRVLIEGMALARVLGRTLEPADHVGLLLPPLIPSAVSNLAVALAGRVAVNLNYTVGETVMNSCIDQCGIRQVITSRKALDRFQLQPKAGLVYLEDLARNVTTVDKAWAFAMARLVPASALGMFVPGLRDDRPEKTATVIFTSGSTGEPKGVVLSHGNLLSNIWAIDNHLRFEPREVVLGILPFFHSFGFCLPLWAMLCLGKKAVYHYNPLDARIIGELCEKHRVSLIVSAPTFVRTFLQRCPAEQFRATKRVILAAEKLKPELARDIQEHWGAIALEGYGTTELSPVVAVNVNHEIQTRDGRTLPGNRPGSVGRPIPGTAVKAVDVETGVDLPRGSVGIVCVKGPQVMQGYLHQPELTAKVIRDGWYTTGDLGKLDEDGFLWITDRLSRFSKIGGEMVPHERVEAAIRQVAGVVETQVAVTSLPDTRRGERLMILYTDLGGKSPAEVCQELASGDLPKLWLPSPTDFLSVEAIPILGTGKLDLSRMRAIARERMTP